MIVVLRSCDGEGGSHLDTALALSVSGSLNVDESLVSPGVSPGVLDLEVLLSADGSISDSEDTVVEVGSAVSAVDSTLVELE